MNVSWDLQPVFDLGCSLTVIKDASLSTPPKFVLISSSAALFQ